MNIIKTYQLLLFLFDKKIELEPIVDVVSVFAISYEKISLFIRFGFKNGL
jgi:hypothetical protein